MAMAQTKTGYRDAAGGVAAVYEVELQNDSADDDRFVITGTAGEAGWTVRYRRNTASGVSDITGAVTSAGWQAHMPAGYCRQIWIEVTPDSAVLEGEALDVFLMATSVNDGAKLDTVKAITTQTTSA